MEVFELEWLLRILCATLMGLCIGYERHNRAKEAGIRTHALVALGACIFMLISKFGFYDKGGAGDPARIAAQVVSGVGFLGAGIIFVRNDMIQGLTTAAGIWTTSAIGMCFGAGLYLLGFAAGVTMFVVQLVFRRMFDFSGYKTLMAIRVNLTRDGTVNDVINYLRRNGYTNTDGHISADSDEGWVFEAVVSTLKDVEPSQLVRKLKELDHVKDAQIL